MCAIAIIRRDVLPGIPRTRRVIDSTGGFDAKRTGHGAGVECVQCSFVGLFQSPAHGGILNHAETVTHQNESLPPGSGETPRDV